MRLTCCSQRLSGTQHYLSKSESETHSAVELCFMAYTIDNSKRWQSQQGKFKWHKLMRAACQDWCALIPFTVLSQLFSEDSGHLSKLISCQLRRFTAPKGAISIDRCFTKRCAGLTGGAVNYFLWRSAFWMSGKLCWSISKIWSMM